MVSDWPGIRARWSIRYVRTVRIARFGRNKEFTSLLGRSTTVFPSIYPTL